MHVADSNHHRSLSSSADIGDHRRFVGSSQLYFTFPLVSRKMAAGFKQNFEEWKNKLDEALHEKNCVNDVLDKIEKKTGVKRLHIALGKRW